jgi:hypothetical protein
MDRAAAFLQCMLELDVAGVRRLHAQFMPHLPAPASDAEALGTLHHARTQSPAMPLKARAWSHRWLLDHGLSSGLPDELKPKAERLYPRVVEAVGISCNARSELMRPIVGLVQGAMENAVAEAFADGRTDTPFVRARMAEARAKTVKQLIGR